MSQKEGIYKLCSLVSGELTDRLETLLSENTAEVNVASDGADGEQNRGSFV